jgi:hypothetical protein
LALEKREIDRTAFSRRSWTGTNTQIVGSYTKKLPAYWQPEEVLLYIKCSGCALERGRK